MFAGNAGCVPEYFHEKPYDAGIYSAHCNGAVPCGYLECIGKREAQKNYSGSQSACCGNSDIFCCEFYVCFVRLSRECGDESDQSCQDAGGVYLGQIQPSPFSSPPDYSSDLSGNKQMFC